MATIKYSAFVGSGRRSVFIDFSKYLFSWQYQHSNGYIHVHIYSTGLEEVGGKGERRRGGGGKQLYSWPKGTICTRGKQIGCELWPWKLARQTFVGFATASGVAVAKTLDLLNSF